MGLRWSLSLLALLAALLFAQPLQAQLPPDVVHLQDGTFLRGTIVERSPTQLVLMLPTGEVRTYPAEQVARVEVGALPTTPTPQAEVEVLEQEAVETSLVHVVTDEPGLTLHRVVGATGRHDNWLSVCTAPCDSQLAIGIHRFGVSLGSGAARRIHLPIQLNVGEHTLQLLYVDQSGKRAAGVTVLGVGLGLGAVAAIIGAVAAASGPIGGTAITFLAAGGITVTLSLLIGLGLAFQGDSADVRIDPDGAIRF